MFRAHARKPFRLINPLPGDFQHPRRNVVASIARRTRLRRARFSARSSRWYTAPRRWNSPRSRRERFRRGRPDLICHAGKIFSLMKSKCFCLAEKMRVVRRDAVDQKSAIPPRRPANAEGAIFAVPGSFNCRSRFASREPTSTRLSGPDGSGCARRSAGTKNRSPRPKAVAVRPGSDTRSVSAPVLLPFP
jgi:hypothetical protein